MGMGQKGNRVDRDRLDCMFPEDELHAEPLGMPLKSARVGRNQDWNYAVEKFLRQCLKWTTNKGNEIRRKMSGFFT